MHAIHAIARAIKRFFTGYLLAILLALAAAAALAITTRMNQMSGIAQAATEEGQFLLGWAAIVVHVAGVVLCGLVAGAAAKRGYGKLALGMAVIVIAAAIFSAMSIMGFMASEALSITQSREALIEQRSLDGEARRKAADKRLEIQARLAEKQMEWNKGLTAQAGRRERREIAKTMQDSSRAIISEIGKESAPQESKAPEPPLMVPDGGSELISNATFGLVSAKGAQTLKLAYLTILLLVLEVVLWPTAGYAWGGFAPVNALALKDETIPSSVSSQEAAEAPHGRLARASPLLISQQTAATGEATPPDSPVASPPIPRIVESPEEAAQHFISWCHATGRIGQKFWGDTINSVYATYCEAQNRQPLRTDDFRRALGELADLPKRKRPVEKGRGKYKEQPKVTFYEVLPTSLAKASPIDRARAQDIETDVGSRSPKPGKRDVDPTSPDPPAATAPGGGQILRMNPFAAASRRSAGSVLAYEVALSRQHKAMLRQEASRSRKQRGSRCHRMARMAA